MQAKRLAFLGIAVIPSDFWSLAACAKVRPLLLDHAVTRCSVPCPGLFRTERRRALPSMAISLASCIDCGKHTANSFRSSSPNTRRNVSCDGTPWGSSPTAPAACSRTVRGRSSRRPRRPRPGSESTRCRTTDAHTMSARADHADPRTSLPPATNPVTSPSMTVVPHSQRVHQHNAALRRQNATAQDTNAPIERLPAVRSHQFELFRMLRNLTPKLTGASAS